jgi:hypothetical protein
MKQIILFFLLLFVASIHAQGTYQPTCIDSTLTNYNLNPCNDVAYDPYCGCDNVTYRNSCMADAAGIINNSYTQGPCEFMDFDFFPNPVSTIGQLKVKVICKGAARINIWIFDMFFHQMYYQYVNYQFPNIVESDFFNPDVRGFGNGMFFMVVEAGGTVKVKRLLVNQIND